MGDLGLRLAKFYVKLDIYRYDVSKTPRTDPTELQLQIVCAQYSSDRKLAFAKHEHKQPGDVELSWFASVHVYPLNRMTVAT